MFDFFLLLRGLGVYFFPYILPFATMLIWACSVHGCSWFNAGSLPHIILLLNFSLNIEWSFDYNEIDFTLKVHRLYIIHCELFEVFSS